MLVNGRSSEARKIFKRIGKLNGHQFDDILTETEEAEQAENKAGLTDLFKNPNIRKNTLSVLVIWLVINNIIKQARAGVVPSSGSSLEEV